MAPHSHPLGAIIPTPRQQGIDEEATDTGSPRWTWARLLKRVCSPKWVASIKYYTAIRKPGGHTREEKRHHRSRDLRDAKPQRRSSTRLLAMVSTYWMPVRSA